MSEELTQEQKTATEEEQLLLGYRVSVDRALKIMPMLSNNGLKRVVAAYVKAGIEELPQLRKEEKTMLNELLALHDIKYTLISKAIDEAKQKQETEESNKENSDG